MAPEIAAGSGTPTSIQIRENRGREDRSRKIVVNDALREAMSLNLSLNLATVRMQWKLPQAVEAAARHGFAGVAPWREMVQETGIKESARIFRANGVRVTGYCRGGLFGAGGRENFKAAIDDNKRMIDEAAAIAAEGIVVIGGGLASGSRDLSDARAMFVEGLAAVLPHARACGVSLALEPMHPMYAADRGCIT